MHVYLQYKWTPCWNCCIKCYSEWITAEGMDEKGRRRRCRRIRTTFKLLLESLVCFPLKYITLNNPVYNLLKLKVWKRGFFVINLSTEDVSSLHSRPTSAISKSFWHLSLPSRSNCNKAKLEHQVHKHTPFKHTQMHTRTCTPLKWAFIATLKI